MDNHRVFEARLNNLRGQELYRELMQILLSLGPDETYIVQTIPEDIFFSIRNLCEIFNVIETCRWRMEIWSPLGFGSMTYVPELFTLENTTHGVQTQSRSHHLVFPPVGISPSTP